MIKKSVPVPHSASHTPHAMNVKPQPCLRTHDGLRVPLKSVSAAGRLDGLLFELTVEQHYCNTSESAIETVYTFPLPLNAVLLSFELDLNGTRHSATAFGRQQAERRYENAIDDGNSAALLVHNGNGLYTATVANLKPNEEAIVRYRYAELLHAHRNQIRLNLPTVIAPRYGNPADAGLEGPAIPGAQLLIEYPFSLRLNIGGVSDPACLQSPSHSITTTPTEIGLAVEIARHASLDRDFVLILDRPAALTGTLVAADGESFVALASAVLPATEADSQPLVAKLLLDCSGSMGGDSIDAAKRALVQILGNLGESDQFSLTRFGSQVEHVTEGLEPTDVHSIKLVTQIVQLMSADMGGTNMPEAIRATIAIPFSRGTRADIVLITDGEVHSVDQVVETAGRSGHRLFVVAIGAAPNEALARRVSESTGGACDFVATGERVEPAILRMFSRLRAAPRTVRDIQWSQTPDWTAPLPSAVFPHDTIHLIAGFRTRPVASVSVTIQGESTQAVTLMLPTADHLVAGDMLPRLAAAQRLAALSDEAARALAIRYQLVSEYTSLVLVAERADDEDKISQLPGTIAVPQMLAAGWGGAGRVPDLMRDALVVSEFTPVLPSPSLRMHRNIDVSSSMREAPPCVVADEDSDSFGEALAADDLMDIPAFLRRQSDAGPAKLTEYLRAAIVKAVVDALAQHKPVPETIAALHALCPLPEWLKQLLESECHVATGRDGTEAEFVRAVLEYLDRNAGLIPFPPAGYFARRRIRVLRQRLAAMLPLEHASGECRTAP